MRVIIAMCCRAERAERNDARYAAFFSKRSQCRFWRASLFLIAFCANAKRSRLNSIILALAVAARFDAVMCCLVSSGAGGFNGIKRRVGRRRCVSDAG